MSLADEHPDHHPECTSRRAFLKTSALASAAILPVIAAGKVRADPESPRVTPPTNARAKNVIFMVSDGMSMGTLSLGDMFIRQSRTHGGRWTGLWSKPGTRRATLRTHALDSLVTDSAAGGCAWGAGRHINNGAINCLPDGTQLLPILIQAKQSGKATGVVTTAKVTHATPASFYANAARRDYEGIIAEQWLKRGIDVALGGGAKFFPKELLDAHKDVPVVQTREQLSAAPETGRLLGVFSPSHIPFVFERDASIPTLPEMTLAALKRLDKNPNGFVLQIEAGRVDHAAHNNDAASLIREQVEFDDTIGAVFDWLSERGQQNDTLVIITTDHANANPGLTLYGEVGATGMSRLAKATHSFDWIADQMAPLKRIEQRTEKLPALVAEASGYELTPVDIRLITESMKDARVVPFVEANKWPSVLGGILADFYGVAFASPNHTADYVEATAHGPGSEPLGGLMDNIDLHGVMVNALGLAKGDLLPDMREPLKMARPPKTD